MPNSIDPEDIWNKRPELKIIRAFAKARRTSPWAVLGGVLMRCLMTAPPHVVLPPTIGGYASLNTFCAVVGASGIGKGASAAVSRECVIIMPPIFTASVGSGEGMIRQFARRTQEKDDDGKKTWVTELFRDAVHFDIPEVDTLAALGARSGTTLLPELRKSYSGEPLGFGYADQEKAATIEAHSYRLTVTVGVQPRRAGALLGDADGGTPQRFVWMPAWDPDMTEKRPDEPAPYVLPDIDWGTLSGASRFHVMEVPKRAREEIERAHINKHTGNSSEELDTHGHQTQLKIAAAFAILAGRDYVSSGDWVISRLFMAKSDETRELCVAELDKALREDAHQRGKQRAVSDAARDGESERIRAQRRRRILTVLDENGAMTRGALNRKLTPANRRFLDADLKALVSAQKITLDDSKYAVTPQPMQ